MILGHGDIASVLPDRDDLVFFARGVSNSREERESEYEREKGLLLQQDKVKRLVYFSSLAMFYSDTRYTKHKLYMEYLIKNNFRNWTIIRLGNITWGNNPHTLINFFRNSIKEGKKFEIQEGFRYIIDKEEFLHWISLIPEFNCEMNITGRRMEIKDIVKEYGNT